MTKRILALLYIISTLGGIGYLTWPVGPAIVLFALLLMAFITSLIAAAEVAKWPAWKRGGDV